MKPKARPGERVPPSARAQPGKDDVNWLNVGLMVAACGGAIAAPFHVFLFAYAVLGPLHYLTEISWLHDRQYFTRRNPARRWWLALVLFTILLVAVAYANSDPSQPIVPPVLGITLVYLVFAASATAIYVRDWRNGVGFLLILACGLFFFSGFRTYAWAVLAANLLTTFVHVFIFTGAFILLGALKSRSRVAVLSLVVFASCAIVAATVTAPFFAPTERVRQLYRGFELLNKELLVLSGRPQSVYESVGVGVMRLIAFAYLYHYLNWFSKTSIIKWHEVPRSRGDFRALAGRRTGLLVRLSAGSGDVLYPEHAARVSGISVESSNLCGDRQIAWRRPLAGLGSFRSRADRRPSPVSGQTQTAHACAAKNQQLIYFQQN